MATSPSPSGGAPDLEARLRTQLRRLDSVVVALSGGVDSSVIAAVAAEELGPQALAVTGASASLAADELPAIAAFCARLGLAHHVVETHELDLPGYVANTPDRCYFCKDELFRRLGEVARAGGFACVVDGTTADDLAGHRPGRRAATEHDVRSPLVELGATKAEVRALARRLGLEVAERPASPCLSSRLAYGTPVTAERLVRIGQAEAYLRNLGFRELRVRAHDVIARIEVPSTELARLTEHAAMIHRQLKDLGFVYVTLDLGGLRSGSLLEVLPAERR